MTVEWKTVAVTADANGVVAASDFITGSELDGVTVLDLGAYCIAVPGASPVNGDWQDTPIEVGGATVWPGDIGALLLPSAGTFIVPDGWSQTGGQEKFFYFRAWPGVLTQVRFWRITE
jgi:hypothetical protein